MSSRASSDDNPPGAAAADVKVRPFLVEVGDDVLADLAARLARTRWPDAPTGPDVVDADAGGGWTAGADLAYLQDLVAYWRDGFDWRAQERAMNALPQYVADLPYDGGTTPVHFVHAPGVGPDPFPLLLLHGWPGSFWEFHRILPLLTDPGAHGGDPADAFTVVAPSLPGYAFSHVPGRRFGLDAIADLTGRLMTDVLGYGRFGGQGGDWGSATLSRLALARPDVVAGLHLNFLFATPQILPDLFDEDTAGEEERAFLAEFKAWVREERGYHAIQGTKPQTLAFALTDSPAGLAAWLAEKFHTWTDNGGVPDAAVSRDDVLTDAMLYWVTGGVGSSFWPYRTTTHGEPVFRPGERVSVPVGHARFPSEIFHPPRSVAEQVYDVRHWSVMDRGGHFAALEQPEALAADVRTFFRPLR